VTCGGRQRRRGRGGFEGTELRSVVAAVTQAGENVAKELASNRAENEDTDERDEASDRMREATCGEDADDVGEEERNESPRRERETR
jgi:hypothetical protein